MKEELKKLKEMTFKEKREYIWEYYKIHILITLFLVFMFGSLINSWFINPPKKEYLYLAWMSGYISDEQSKELSARLTSTLVEDIAKEEVAVSTFFTGSDQEYNMATYNRLVAMIAAAELDVFIMDRDTLTDMAAGGYLAPLDALTQELQKSEFAALYETVKPLTVEAEYAPEKEDDLQTAAFGIGIENCPGLTALDIYTQDLYLGVAVNSQKIPAVARALQVLYE